MSGKPNPLYTEVFPSEDFAAAGYWFWLKSPKAHGFDVKAFDPDHIYMRSTELQWEDNRTFKRFVHDLPVAARCVSEVRAGARDQSGRHNLPVFLLMQPIQNEHGRNRSQ